MKTIVDFLSDDHKSKRQKLEDVDQLATMGLANHLIP